MMADILKNDKVTRGMKQAYESFNFCALKVGLFCNGMGPCPFDEADCDLSPALYQDPSGPKDSVVALNFSFLYKKFFHLIEDLWSGTQKFNDLEEPYQKAFQTLQDFIQDIEKHEASLAQLLQNGDTVNKVSRTDVSIAAAVHLIGKLSPVSTFVIDRNCKEDGTENCKCGCGADITYGGTGIGDIRLWHGFYDIIMKSQGQAVSAVLTTLDIDKTKSVEDKEPESKRAKHNDDKSENVDQHGDDDEEDQDESENPHDEEADLENQSTAKAIVFALLQKYEHPNFANHLIPTILVSPSSVKIIMYDPENDILLHSSGMKLFSDLSDKSLDSVAIIVIWMVLNYRLFCSGVVVENLHVKVEDIKSGFAIHKRRIHEIYMHHLKMCAPSFPAQVFKRRVPTDHVINHESVCGNLPDQRILTFFQQ